MSGKIQRLSARGREAWTGREAEVLDRLQTPEKIQAYLERIPYNTDDQCRSPRRVMAERRAHCMEGALMAAAALRYHGFGCRILDLMAVRDDDHVIALFRQLGGWGAVRSETSTMLSPRSPSATNTWRPSTARSDAVPPVRRDPIPTGCFGSAMSSTDTPPEPSARYATDPVTAIALTG